MPVFKQCSNLCLSIYTTREIIDGIHRNEGCNYVTYILQSQDLKYLYVGSTNDTNRRIRQHNLEISGGAKYTKCYGPWNYFAIIKGFRNHSECLRFEYRLQRIPNPNSKKRRLIRPNLIKLHHLLPHLDNLIRLGDGSIKKNNKQPWLPLTITWFNDFYSNSRVINEYRTE